MPTPPPSPQGWAVAHQMLNTEPRSSKASMDWTMGTSRFGLFGRLNFWCSVHEICPLQGARARVQAGAILVSNCFDTQGTCKDGVVPIIATQEGT